MNTLPSDALVACALRVEKGDPDRFLAAMAAPAPGRAGLMVLYAFNLEIARAPWVTHEPLVARMRLQFWRDLVADPDTPRPHEVAEPLAALIRDRELPAALLHAVIDAREAEIDGGHLLNVAALGVYLERSAGALMSLAVRVLGDPCDAVASEYGLAQGMANYLMAVPAIQAAGRTALPPGAEPAALASQGLRSLASARARRHQVPGPARFALLAAWRAGAILRQVQRDPGAVLEGRLVQSEFRRRGSLLWASVTRP